MSLFNNFEESEKSAIVIILRWVFIISALLVFIGLCIYCFVIPIDIIKSNLNTVFLIVLYPAIISAVRGWINISKGDKNDELEQVFYGIFLWFIGALGILSIIIYLIIQLYNYIHG